jgi:CHAD domain-containing protein
MNRQEHLLTVAGEEGSEIQQRTSKALRFGMEQVQQARGDRPEQNPERLTNRQRILEEFHDLVAVLDMLGLVDVRMEELRDGENVAMIEVDLNAIRAKQNKVEHYLKLSAEQGTLTD